MTCPYMVTRGHPSNTLLVDQDDADASVASQLGYNGIVDENQPCYSNYLKLPQMLSLQQLRSAGDGRFTPVHDEHLFIVTHQTFELWFKQILYEIDSVREIFASSYLEERNQLTVISRLNRVSEILKLLSSQFLVMETMTPQDFLEMRQFLENGSGFQSLQFRMMEIRLGVREELRVLYNKRHYVNVFFGEERKNIERARSEKSLFDLVNDWLERTPGLEPDGFDFFNKFKCSVNGMLDEEKANAESCKVTEERENVLEDHKRRCEVFDSLFSEDTHKDLVAKGQRRFTHKAMQGALMIFLYREEPRVHLPFQILNCLMDIDNHMTKFRYIHTCMVQRMIGGKIGTGGSSGYLYLRSTCSDRYKVFLDLLNLPSYLVTRDRIPPLTARIQKSLSIHDWMNNINDKRASDAEIDSGITQSFRRISFSSMESFEPVVEQVVANKKKESTV